MQEKKGISSRLAMCTMLICWAIWTFFWIDLNIITFPKRDLLYYGTAVCLAFAIFLLSYKFFPQMDIKENRIRENVLAFFSFVGLGIGIIRVFVHPYLTRSLSTYYMDGQYESIIRVVIDVLIIVLAGGLYYFLSKKIGETKGRKHNLTLLYLVIAVNAGWFFYMPNCYKMDLWHYNAYFHSIKRVLDLAPYSAANTGVYGFYGILCAPLVKLMGGSVVEMAIVVSVLISISVLCLCYVMDNMLDKTLFKILGTIGITTFMVWGRAGGYCQAFPHRLFFVSIILAYIVWIKKNNRTNVIWKIIGVILCALSVVWNFETGIACLAAWIGSDVVFILQKDSLKSRSCLLEIGSDILQAPIALALAYVIVNLYNVCVGGEWLTVSECLFPLTGTRNGYMDFLVIHLPKGVNPWLFSVGILLIAMGLVLSRTSLCGCAEENLKMVFLAACTIAAMVQITYYINRSADILLWLILPVFSIIMAFLSEHILLSKIWSASVFGNGVLRSFGVWTMASLGMLGMLLVIKYVPMYREQSIMREMESFKAFAAEVQEKIPEGTLGIGVGVDEIYSYLGWENGYYGIDFPDYLISEAGYDYLLNLLMESDALFVNDYDINTVYYNMGQDIGPWLATHDILVNIPYGDYEYRYYVKKNY